MGCQARGDQQTRWTSWKSRITFVFLKELLCWVRTLASSPSSLWASINHPWETLEGFRESNIKAHGTCATGHLVQEEDLHSSELAAVFSQFRNTEILINTFQNQSEKYTKMILVACMLWSESCRVSALLESLHKQRECKNLYHWESRKIGPSSISNQLWNFTFKAHPCDLWLNLKWRLVSLSYQVIRACQCFVSGSTPRVSPVSQSDCRYLVHAATLPRRLAKDPVWGRGLICGTWWRWHKVL